MGEFLMIAVFHKHRAQVKKKKMEKKWREEDGVMNLRAHSHRHC